MQEILSQMIGRRVDVRCSGAPNLRGLAVKVESGVLHLMDEDGLTYYIAVDKISVVWEVHKDEQRAGFVPLKS